MLKLLIIIPAYFIITFTIDRIKYPPSDIKLVIKYGFPGVGKTVDIVRECLLARKKHRKVYTTVEDINIPGVIKFDPQNYGKYRFYGDCLVLIDEAGIVFNNRNWKEFTENIEYSKLHRHDKARIILYSQSPEDTDVTLRRLAQESWDMKKIFGYWSIQRKIICENTIVKAAADPDKGKNKTQGTYAMNQRYASIFGGLKIYHMPRFYGHNDTFIMPDRFKQIPCEMVPGLLPYKWLSFKDKLKVIFVKNIRQAYIRQAKAKRLPDDN